MLIRILMLCTLNKMKMKNIHLLFASALVFFACLSCSKDPIDPVEPISPVSSAEFETVLKASL